MSHEVPLSASVLQTGSWFVFTVSSSCELSSRQACQAHALTTTDGGRSFRRLGSPPPDVVASPREGGLLGVFASSRDGWLSYGSQTDAPVPVSGSEWETLDGGRNWHRLALSCPGGVTRVVAAGGGSAYALVSRPPPCKPGPLPVRETVPVVLERFSGATRRWQRVPLPGPALTTNDRSTPYGTYAISVVARGGRVWLLEHRPEHYLNGAFLQSGGEQLALLASTDAGHSFHERRSPCDQPWVRSLQYELRQQGLSPSPDGRTLWARCEYWNERDAPPYTRAFLGISTDGGATWRDRGRKYGSTGAIGAQSSRRATIGPGFYPLRRTVNGGVGFQVIRPDPPVARFLGWTFIRYTDQAHGLALRTGVRFTRQGTFFAGGLWGTSTGGAGWERIAVP